MPRGSHSERIKKQRQDEGGSSEPVVAPRRSLRERKRAPANDDIEDVNANTESENDSESNPEFVAQTRSGHRLGEDDEAQSDDGDTDGSNDDDISAHGDDNEVGMPMVHVPFYAYGRRPVDYAKDRMTDAVKQNRMLDPYATPKHDGDTRFWNKFQQDFYTTVIYKKRPKITHDA